MTDEHKQAILRRLEYLATIQLAHAHCEQIAAVAATAPSRDAALSALEKELSLTLAQAAQIIDMRFALLTLDHLRVVETEVRDLRAKLA